MGNFDKDIFMKGCHLITRVSGDSSNLYQFIFNPETKDHSNIAPCGTGLDYELEDDGLYRIVTLQAVDANLDGEDIIIGFQRYTVDDILDAIKDEVENPVFTYDIDDTLSICNLKKCLVELEMKVFREMLKNCGEIVCKDDQIKAQRDFLFIAVWLMEHYVEIGNIEKAWSIFERLRGCGNLCGDLLNNKKGCGCNG